MKRLLLASTLLASAAAPAAADIAISAESKMGIVGGDLYAPTDEAQFFNDLTLTFEGTGETDGGLTFGFVIEMVKGAGPTVPNGATACDSEEAFIEGSFGRLSLGGVDGAYYTRVGEANLGASIADDETLHAGYFAGDALDGSEDGQILRYDYDTGGFGLSLSLEQDNNGAGSDDIYGLGLSYAAEAGGVGLTVALGYQSNSNDDLAGASVMADFGNGFQAALTLADFDAAAAGADFSHVGVGLGYSTGAWSVSGNYGAYDFSGAPDQDGFGLTAAYDLGGGAALHAGYGDGEGVESWSLGMIMAF
ncbi:porin [Rhodovulum adriaticum]|uniref:Outer membrane protein OmpU n=1 Tax=Rhodovulum adriaticum TaxID=35804 RepID=A0A4R2NKS4_RHOAD|nr:porin [Rhodovulum adriaticum]MBK1637042.1 hypothetical protein [Rhodovulum adriaticum]TCP21982.1 outer membrane protein OmpU [Rhodovulum adriaticum]